MHSLDASCSAVAVVGVARRAYDDDDSLPQSASAPIVTVVSSGKVAPMAYLYL